MLRLGEFEGARSAKIATLGVVISLSERWTRAAPSPRYRAVGSRRVVVCDDDACDAGGPMTMAKRAV